MVRWLWIIVLLVIASAACGAPPQQESIEPSVTDTPAVPDVFPTATLLIPTVTPTPTITTTPIPAATATAIPRRPVVVLDPGHTPDTVGAVSSDGQLVEHVLTLALSQKIAPLLEEQGFTVFMTRQADGSLVLPAQDENGNGKLDDYEYLQPRTDLANRVNADILVSLHFNGSLDPALSGTSVYYASVGPYIAASMRLGHIIQWMLVQELQRHDYHPVDLGVLSDDGLKPYGTLYSLGQNPQFARKGRWPGVVIEPLFLTNASDAAFLKRSDALDIIAQACTWGISAYFGGGCCGRAVMAQ